MRIIVCIKQVPLIQALKFDPEKKTIIREGVPNEVSAFDIIALTEAVRIREQLGGEVIALTMGPPQARDALIECLAVGADRAVHLTDRAFAGSDTLATARALALAIRRLGFDLILCGRNSLDAETGQVGPELAELLDIPQVTAVRKLQIGPSKDKLVAERETDDGIEVVECPLPALVTAAEALNEGIWVTPDQKKAVEGRPLEVVTASDLSADTSIFGVSGSPTYVREIYSIQPKREGTVVPGDDLGASINRLVDYLLGKGLFGQWKDVPASRPAARRKGASTSGKSVWVVAEAGQHALRPVSLEMLGKGIELADRLQGELAAVLLGHNLQGHVKTLGMYGADTLYVADSPALAGYSTEVYTTVLARAIQRYHPEFVLFPSTAWGRDLAPRVAARLQVGLTGDCIGLEIDDQGKLVQLKPAFGGNIVAPILSRTLPQMATIRPGVLEMAEPDPDRSGRTPVVRYLAVDVQEPARTRVLQRTVTVDEKASELDTADIVVGVGMGVGGPENLPIIYRLAEVLGAAVGATRNVTDHKWLPKQQQIGLTGKAIAPRLYIAVGIRGDFNHMVGVQKAGTIVAINKNKNARIFKGADFGIVADYAVAVPALTRALQEAKQRV